MIEKKVIYYQDELNDEFSTAQITPRTIDKNYKYKHKSIIWNITSWLVQNVLSVPIKELYAKFKFKISYVGKEKIKPFKKQGYFVYGNHTQSFADTFIITNAIFPKRNFYIVNPENVSMKILGNFVQMLGAIPIPNNINGMKNFIQSVEEKISKGYAVSIFPEAHIWPYYTKIRPFKSVSFKYPIDLNVPSFCVTNTYQSYGKKNNKVKIITYIDGPFYPNKQLSIKEQREDLRNRIFQTMTDRSKNSNIEYITYINKNGGINEPGRNNEYAVK